MTKPKDDPYAKVVDFIAFELGLCFTDTPSNINALAAHLGIDRRQTHAVLGTMTRKGKLRWDRIGRTWTVVQTGQKVA